MSYPIWSRRFWIRSLIAAVLVLTALSGLAQEEPPSLSERITIRNTSRAAVFDSRTFSGKRTAIPYWDKGHLVSWNIEAFAPDASRVRVYDGEGRQTGDATIWFPGTTRVLITSATMSRNGGIIASGIAARSDGVNAGFIVHTDQTGSVKDVIQTGDFGPHAVCEAPDDSVWAFGMRSWDESKNAPKPGNALRQFRFDRGEVSSYLPEMMFAGAAPYISTSYLRCLSDRVVAYSGATNTYTDLHYEGSGEPRIAQIQSPGGSALVGFAASESGDVFGYFARVDWGPIGDRKPENGLYVLHTRDFSSRASWVSVKFKNPSDRVAGLYGIDGSTLIVRQVADPAGRYTLRWFSLLSQ
jgi:hypothetical protein